METPTTNAQAAVLAERALERALAEVKTSAQAEAVVRELRRQAAGHAPGMAEDRPGVARVMVRAIDQAADSAPARGTRQDGGSVHGGGSSVDPHAARRGAASGRGFPAGDQSQSSRGGADAARPAPASAAPGTGEGPPADAADGHRHFPRHQPVAASALAQRADARADGRDEARRRAGGGGFASRR